MSRPATAPRYRLFALPTTPPKPGLVRAPDGEPGHAIELEVWELADEALGRFMRGSQRRCASAASSSKTARACSASCASSAAIEGQREISSFGGWRAYRRSIN